MSLQSSPSTPLTAPIAVLDSGVGGLTVVKALRTLLPAEDILYFGDTARVPYGNKSEPTVTAFVRQIISYLVPRQPKHLVIACNTATALALPILKREFPQLTITGVVDPGARAAAQAAGSKLTPLIGVIATEATVRCGAYNRAIHRRRSKARVIQRAAPLLVPIIEEGREESDLLVQLALQQYLEPLIAHQPDVLVLGCTHYPIFKRSIAELMGPACRVIDSAEQCAQDVARRLREAGLLRTGSLGAGLAARFTGLGGAGGSLQCLVTDDSPRFQMLAERFLEVPMAAPTLVDLSQQSPPPAPLPLRQAG
jgi:glutamate racemase